MIAPHTIHEIICVSQNVEFLLEHKNQDGLYIQLRRLKQLLDYIPEKQLWPTTKQEEPA